jgi:hypothetical protein
VQYSQSTLKKLFVIQSLSLLGNVFHLRHQGLSRSGNLPAKRVLRHPGARFLAFAVKVSGKSQGDTAANF